MPPAKVARLLKIILAGLICLIPAIAQAGGPRWVSGKPYFTNSDGKPVVWFTPNPQYFTDPGDLSVYVNHAAADALVAEAAATWNVNVATITLAQGGSLDEHVSGANVYLGANGPVFPTDVLVANGPAKQIAVIYDTDGSITDILLGGGASDPGNCRQTAVTESVDGIAPSNLITHALLVLNGRCTGPNPEAQLEMKYRLIRAFGRILGLSWSQTNDNVFTGSPQASSAQGLNWPIMHPIDIVCGPYAYQCLQQPFTLRIDDVASLVSVYPNYIYANGKVPFTSVSGLITGTVAFSNGQGMQGVNVVVRRYHPGINKTDTYDVASSISGYRFQREGGNPVIPKGTALADSFGWPTQMEGTYDLPFIPVNPGEPWNNMLISTQPVNPLYTGQYAVGPYTNSQVTPSGGTLTGAGEVVGRTNHQTVNLIATTGAGPCLSASDGTEAAPADVPPTGIWSGTLCGYNHTAWSTLPIQSGRTLTIEITALDEQGYATTGKLQPVMGVWATTDPVKTLPTIASVAVAMNTQTLGLTALNFSNDTAHRLRIGLGDMRGDGRPDYAYAARILYADSITPSTVPLAGGQVTITGLGFRPGNTVTVNGQPAQVLSWTPTAIVATAPASAATTADVTVTDLSTQGETTMSASLAYSDTAAPDLLQILSAPPDGSVVNTAATAPFTIQVTLPDGVTPAAKIGVTLSATGATLAACSGSITCILTTDASGRITTLVTPLIAGTITLKASLDTTTVSTSFQAAAQANDILSVQSLPSGTVYAGVPATIPFAVKVLLGDGITPAANTALTLTSTGATLGACANTSPCTITTDASGIASTTVTPQAAGLITLRASAGGASITASFAAVTLPPDQLHLTSLPANNAYTGSPAANPLALQVILGDGVTPAAGATVKIAATQATLGACGAPICTLTADAQGLVSTPITPTAPGLVTLTATAGGGTLAASFTAIQPPPDILRLVSIPANGTTVGTPAQTPFAFTILLPDGVTPAPGIAASVSATGATLTACGLSTCSLVSDTSGLIQTTVTPTQLGTIALKASATGGSLSVSFTSSADKIQILSQPTNLVYAGVPARTPFIAQVLLSDGITPAAGTTVSISATLSTLAACNNSSSCVLTADANGTISTILTPTTPGTVTIQLTAGGATTVTSFNALPMPPDVVKILAFPPDLTYTNLVSTTPFTVQVFLGDRITLAAGIPVKLLSPMASLGNCGTACTVITDANGMLSTSVTPLVPGLETIQAIAGGVTASASFLAVQLPPDIVTIKSVPANGSLTGRPAPNPFTVQTYYGDGLTPAFPLATTITVTGGIVAACNRPTCVLYADPTGTVSATIISTAAGAIGLIATAGGVTVAASFTAVLPPDILTITSAPIDGAFTGQPTPTPFSVKASLGNGGRDIGVPVTIAATNATLGACALSTCIVTADSTGLSTTPVIPTAPGQVTLTATARGTSISTSFNTLAAPDILQLLSLPTNGSYTGRPATNPLSIQILLPNSTIPAPGAIVTLTAAGATLGICGTPSCQVTADATGTVSTTVTPTTAGLITLTASAGGGKLAATFTAATPPDIVHILSTPADGSFAGRPATIPFAAQTLYGDGITPVASIATFLTATGGIFSACGRSSCVLLADTNGTISTTVTPTQTGTITLTATAAGVTATSSFTAVLPPDILSITATPADGSIAGQAAPAPFTVKASLGNGGPDTGAAVTITATNATLASCGLSTCILTANSTGLASTTVIPTAPGPVDLTATAAGGSVSTSFNAVPPPDILHLLSLPANGSYTGRPATNPLIIHVLLPDGHTPASGAAVTLTATGATLGACGASTCQIAADTTGTVSTIVTPTTAGLITLSATAGGGKLAATFTTAAPPDIVRILSTPADGSFVSKPAGTPLSVQTFYGDGVTPIVSLAVFLKAAGATLSACGRPSCVLFTDTDGVISTTVTPTQTGTIGLTATAGGVTATSSFSAAQPPDVLSILSVPADGSLTGQPAAAPFTVKAALGTGGPDPGAAVTITATGATLGACGLSTCVVTADATGIASTPVTPTLAGLISLAATAGGGKLAASFTAATPPDIIRLISAPTDGSYLNRPAATAYALQVLAPDGKTPASNTPITLSATGATLAACGLPSCLLTTGASGFVSTIVTPTTTGPATLSAAAAGGTQTVTFNAVPVPPDTFRLLSFPSGVIYVSLPATTPFTVQFLPGDGSPAAGIPITLTAVGATLTACGSASTCVLPADSSGKVSTQVIPTTPGQVTLTAAAGNGSISASFPAVPLVRVLSPEKPTEYVAPGATVLWKPQIAVTQNGLPATGLAITWTSKSSGITLAGTTSTVGSDGIATNNAAIGPLTAGQSATANACAWVNICTSIQAQAVDAPEWRLAIVSGGNQSVIATASLQPVTARVVDTSGHGIAGVPVAIHQVVTAWVTCPPTGRCPIAPILATSAASLTSDVDGLITIAPQDLPGEAEITKIVLTAGPYGAASISLSKTP